WRVGAWVTTAIMVSAWGAILVRGVTDPLGGINTFYPLFGIANLLLAAIALAVCMAFIAKRGLLMYLWVVALPLTFAAVVTIYASYLKIFSDVPAVGYFAQNRAFAEALASGETSFGTASTVEAMQAVVRNTMVQGVLSVLFVTLAIIVILSAVIATWRSWKSRSLATSEDPARPSRIFGPASFMATRAEKAIQAQWDAQSASERSRR
ncbi:MAG: carbon starvation protein, partial [Homoserinimonas sp.]|nr:carbon starvation protein [Homoserinimonas sp.]